MKSEAIVTTLKGLTLKQERFVREFIATRKVIQSYKTAYDTENMQDNTIQVASSQELAKPHIQKAIVSIMMDNPGNEPDDLNPEFIKRQLKLEINRADSDGARVSALNVASKVFGMQTMKTIDETAKQDDKELALGVASNHYAQPPATAADLEPNDKLFYNELLRRLTIS